MDPGPVTLNLGTGLNASPAGASAAGTDSYGVQATVYQWPSHAQGCRNNTTGMGAPAKGGPGGGFMGGEPSNAGGMQVNSTTSQTIGVGTAFGCLSATQAVSQ